MHPHKAPDAGTEVLFDWRVQYDPVRDAEEGWAAALHDFAPTVTVQSFAQDADINTLMKRFGVTDGAIPPAVPDPRYYGDFSDVPDFRAALDATREAQQRFNLLPAEIRNRFAEDPVRLWEFVNDPANTEESVKLGLLKRPEPPAIPAVTQTPPAPKDDA